MLIHHTKERADLLGEKAEPRKATALQVMLALAAVRAGRPIKTVKVPK